MEKEVITKKKKEREASITHISKEKVAEKTARNNPNIIEDLHFIDGVWRRIN
jgi:hypothetical protein